MDTTAIISQLLKNRDINSPKDISEFFDPSNPEVFPSPFDSTSAIQLIKHHIHQKNRIAIFGDYDVDGVCSTAIVWETLRNNAADVFPHIPHRKDEGYGLSKKGIDICLQNGAKLLIAVDNGIVAHEQIAYAKSQGCDCIIIDHHEALATYPPADCILHATNTCAACLAWLFCRDFQGMPNQEHLSLAALAVICDMIPLTGFNRSIATHGLSQLRNTHRVGIIALCEQAGFAVSEIDTYKVGFVLGPRINAMGRLDHALDSLRLLCTTNPQRARELATTLDQTNKFRQDLTAAAVDASMLQMPQTLPSILAVSDPSYEEGIIGLVASKLVEKFYRPSIVIAEGSEICKGSARSVTGFHITDHLRNFSDILTAVGGHAMAAGFSLPTSRLEEFKQKVIEKTIDNQILTRKQRVDMAISTASINRDLYNVLQKFAPFGLGNPQPVFESIDITAKNPKKIGIGGKHLKFFVDTVDAIFFNAPADIDLSQIDSIKYSIAENNFAGKSTLQLMVKNVTERV